MCKKTLSLLAVALLTGVGITARSAAEDDKARIQGTWLVVDGERNGKKIPPVELKTRPMSMTFRGDKVVVKVGNRAEPAEPFILREGKKPKTIDVAPKKMHGIYDLSGDRLSLLFHSDRKLRPTAFGKRTGAGETLLILHRQKPAPRTALSWAVEMVKGLKPDHTSYRHKDPSVKWKGIDGAKDYESHTDCSGFLNALFRRAYGYTDETFSGWLGTKRPLAKTYHEAIVKGNRFKRIALLKDVQPGDVIAIKYRPDDPENTDHNTGHVLLVVKAPQPRKATGPKVAGTTQWEVTVIDQSRSGHGKTDTRRKPDGTFGPGLGQGVLRIYTHKSGKVAGYSWSTLSASGFHDQKDRPLVLGRLVTKP